MSTANNSRQVFTEDQQHNKSFKLLNILNVFRQLKPDRNSLELFDSFESETSKAFSNEEKLQMYSQVKRYRFISYFTKFYNTIEE